MQALKPQTKRFYEIVFIVQVKLLKTFSCCKGIFRRSRIFRSAKNSRQ